MICPRCDCEEAYKFFEAPEDASWELYRCPVCFLVWRNTEEECVTNPELYDKRFKLSQEKIAEMKEKPPIPPLKTG